MINNYIIIQLLKCATPRMITLTLKNENNNNANITKGKDEIDHTRCNKYANRNSFFYCNRITTNLYKVNLKCYELVR